MENQETPTESESGTTPVTPDETTQLTHENETAEKAPAGSDEEELDLNQMFPGEDTDLNELFPEKELRELLQGVHKSKTELEKINTRFVDDPDHVVPKLNEDSPEE